MMHYTEFTGNGKQLIGDPYIYGGNYGETDVVTKPHLLAVQQQYPEQMTSEKMDWLLEHFAGMIGGDCSGTVTKALRLPKINSATLWSYCTKKGNIANIPNIAGLIVYRVGHIGIYLGNGQVLENGSTKYGCKITDINNPITGKAWTNYGYLERFVDYNDYKKVYYKGHVQNIGWMPEVSDGNVCGTIGKALRMEAIQIHLGVSGGIEYHCHVQNQGWQPWNSNNQIAGTVGQALRMEAVQIRLTGEADTLYDVYYRAHVQDIGWMPWVKDGETAGTTGRSLRLEALRIMLVPKGQLPPA